MQYILDGSQMKQVDQYSIETVLIPSLVLMERAALAVCSKIKGLYENSQKILCVCGVGNNGADGIACARILREDGYDTAICIAGNTEKATNEWRQQMTIAKNLGIRTVTLDELSAYDVVVDGIFGIGLSKNVTGDYEHIIDVLNQSGKDIISVDIPSGIHATTGHVMQTAIRAKETITFGYRKTGLLLYPGAEYAGRVTVAECGFAPDAVHQVGNVKKMLEACDLSLLPKRRAYSNKGSYGKVLIVAGSKNMSGAAYFSAKAAYRMGAGLVRVLTCRENKEALQKLLPEAVLAFYDELDEKELEEQITWADVLAAGPGLSTGVYESELLYRVLSVAEHVVKHILLDADALNILARDGRLDMLKGTTITPHLGEMSRLNGKSVVEIQQNLIGEATAFAKEKECICVLKDARTIVTDGDNTYINSSGNSGMATAGSGDVLTGIIAGMWANGMENLSGAALGVYVHGAAGDAAREELGEYFMKADDIADSIKNVINHL